MKCLSGLAESRPAIEKQPLLQTHKGQLSYASVCERTRLYVGISGQETDNAIAVRR